MTRRNKDGIKIYVDQKGNEYELIAYDSLGILLRKISTKKYIKIGYETAEEIKLTLKFYPYWFVKSAKETYR
jgi:hypothetical protein